MLGEKLRTDIDMSRTISEAATGSQFIMGTRGYMAPSVVRNDILKPAIDHVSAQSVPGLFSRFRMVSARMEVAKLGAAVKGNRADEPTCRRYAELLVATGDWKSALEAFAKLRDAGAAQAAKDELAGKALASAGDFWWEYKPGADMAAEAVKAHAAELYSRAIASGELTGLKKVVAEKRIAEVGFIASTSRLYCVVDLSGGPNATNYPVSYMSSAPTNSWPDEYKTTKLVLRRIEAGTFIMGDNQKDESHRVTLTKPFYIGVFEVTQKHWELVMGNNPSEFKGDMRPVECVSYDMIRGKEKGSQWPKSAAVDEGSFLGRLRAKTRLDTFDLPTEAQWEYACRSGTTSTYNNGGDTEDDLKKLARYKGTEGHQKKHTTAGSYLPNAWGLYDMYGNVWECCLDWKGELPFGTDPVGVASDSNRVRRGGGWGNYAQRCHSASRFYYSPSNRGHDVGFRLCCSAGLR